MFFPANSSGLSGAHAKAPGAFGTLLLVACLVAVLVAAGLPSQLNQYLAKQDAAHNLAADAVLEPSSAELPEGLARFPGPLKLSTNVMQRAVDEDITRILHVTNLWLPTRGRTEVWARGRHYVFHLYTPYKYTSAVTVLDLTQAEPGAYMSTLPDTARLANQNAKAIGMLLADAIDALDRQRRDAVFRETGKY